MLVSALATFGNQPKTDDVNILSTGDKYVKNIFLQKVVLCQSAIYLIYCNLCILCTSSQALIYSALKITEMPKLCLTYINFSPELVQYSWW